MTTETKPTTTVTTTPVSTPAKTGEIVTPKPPAFTQEQLMQLAAVVQAVNGGGAQVPTTARPMPPAHVLQSHEECNVCHQYVSACNNKHKSMVVFPTKYPEYSDFFTGVKINGAKYYSHGPNEYIEVPECCVGTILSAINDFEENERTVHIPRSKQHNSGSLGKHGTGARQATSAWR